MLGQFFVQGWAPDPLLWAQHDPWLVLPSIFASWVALHVLMRPVLSAPVLWAAAVLVGAGIGTMHYVGMAASELAPFMRYDLGGFVLSLVVAVVLAALALWVRFGLQRFLPLGSWANGVLAGVMMGSCLLYTSPSPRD